MDECHIGTSNKLKGSYKIDRGKFNQFLDEISPKKIIGLTATPIQLVNNSFGSELKIITRSKRSFWYQADIFHITQIAEIKDKYWANLQFRVANNYNDSALDHDSRTGDFSYENIVKAFEDNNNLQNAKNQYHQLVKEGKRSIITFVPSQEAAYSLRAMIPGSDVVTAQTATKTRKEFIAIF